MVTFDLTDLQELLDSYISVHVGNFKIRDEKPKIKNKSKRKDVRLLIIECNCHLKEKQKQKPMAYSSHHNYQWTFQGMFHLPLRYE